jgi:hypothetical protein
MTIEAVLTDHAARYPAMQMQDLYKLIYQAALGCEHAISDLQAARKWLEREIAETEPDSSEPVLDPISDDGQIVRVHLQPFLAAGGRPEALLQAFIRTASEYRGDVKVLEHHWNIAAGLGVYPAAEMSAFIQSMKKLAYPVVHHSPEYRHLYRPAYRVVWVRFLSPAK